MNKTTKAAAGSKLLRMLTQSQRAQANQLSVTGTKIGAFRAVPVSSPYALSSVFHAMMQMKVPKNPIVPSVSQRERRLRLILEEFLELVEAMGFELVLRDEFQMAWRTGDKEKLSILLAGAIGVRHVEESRYDVVETADALGDLNVVVNGTAVDFGIPMPAIDYEIFSSNMTKLDPEGNPIVNHCKVCGPNPADVYLSTCDCNDGFEQDESNWLKPGVPLGKILKPEGYKPPNIPAVLLAATRKD